MGHDQPDRMGDLGLDDGDGAHLLGIPAASAYLRKKMLEEP